MGEPPFDRLASSAFTTYRSTFDKDLADYVATGIAGIGLLEEKLPAGDDARALDAFLASGLAAAFCFPAVPSVLPGDTLFRDPVDPGERIGRLCAGIRRLAPFRPVAVTVYAGPPGSRDPAEARRLVVEALRAAGDAAGETGTPLAIEVLRPSRGGSLAPTVEDALALAEDAGHPEIAVLLDAWHTEPTPDTLDQIARHGDRILGLQLCDRPPQPRTWMDRVMPGDGTIDLPALVAAVAAANPAAWWELEVFSDDGTFGTDLPDSLWHLPARTLLERGRDAFARTWAASR